MHEEILVSTNKPILHIYPSTGKVDRTVEHHVFRDSQGSKLYRHFKVRVKKLVRSQTKVRRKHPRTQIEHTDFEKYPHKMTCPNCLSYIKTDVYYYNTCRTHMVAASLTPVCMCMVPYCITTFKNAAHYCPACNIYLGTNFGSARELFRCFRNAKHSRSNIS
ncbi:uncharacterized protein LOC143215481 [Lasioglossum baleicum]|uniref:uncharacterized protein LOC143215481 n=1 Tax=Lasioglossum baleicum TaxID=434251 RepID=UPI003FCD24BD